MFFLFCILHAYALIFALNMYVVKLHAYKIIYFCRVFIKCCSRKLKSFVFIGNLRFKLFPESLTCKVSIVYNFFHLSLSYKFKKYKVLIYIHDLKRCRAIETQERKNCIWNFRLDHYIPMTELYLSHRHHLPTCLVQLAKTLN